MSEVDDPPIPDWLLEWVAEARQARCNGRWAARSVEDTHAWLHRCIRRRERSGEVRYEVKVRGRYIGSGKTRQAAIEIRERHGDGH